MNLTKPQKLIYDMEKFAGGSIAVICGSMLTNGKREIFELKRAVNEVYRLNDALRIRIIEDEVGTSQSITEYEKREIEVLRFENKAELDTYAENYAKEPLDFYGDLCEIKVALLPEQYGVLVKLHHIIGDAWTLSLIGNQFNAFLNGETPEAYSYADYVTSEQQYTDSRKYEKDKAFFIEQFKKCDEVTYLSEKQSNSFAAKRKTFVFGKEEAKKITDYAAMHETSAFMLFTAALAAYMNRVKMNAEKFYIGTAVLNRATVKEKITAGMFINTVPMLIELNNEKSFAENLSGMTDTVFSVFRHQKYNYGDMLNDLRSQFSFGEKLYDVMISYQNATISGGNDTTWYHCGMQTESLQIHIDDRDNEGIFRIHYDYLTDKFTEHDIEMLHAHLLNLLSSAIQDDSKKIYELNLLTEEEKQKLLFDFNDTAVDYPRDKCVHTLFEEQVEKTPDKKAVIACDKTLTYNELNSEANRIAHALIEKGVGVGDIVAFALTRHSYLISTILGILKSGAAYLPIDPGYPQDRIDYILKDSKAKFYVNEQKILDLLSNSCSENPNINITSENLCYCIYTSGSTGMPKGVMINHKNVVNFCHSNKANPLQSFVFENCSNVLACGSITFDISNFEIILSLLLNKTVFIASENQLSDVNQLAMLMEKNKIDCIHCTPTKLETYLSNDSFRRAFKYIKCVMVGGESLTQAVLNLIQKSGNAKIFNGYGPSETTMAVSFGEITGDSDITLGKPIANTQIYIVDPYMNLTPIGVTGELCIAGDGVGAEYLNRPELTAEKFIDNPFGKSKLYKTGDLAYWREDGNIVYVGRNDFQVKIRGLRIELGEIENAISSVDGISQSVVVVRQNNEGRQLICAFYTGKEVEPKEIRAHIGKKLPKYMLPHIFTHLDEMPLTTSGKINRKALPEVDLYNIVNETEFVAPTSEREKELCKLMEEVLKTSPIGITDDFFDLGGDSLKSIEFVSKAHSEGIYFNLQNVFDYPTVSALCDCIENGDKSTVSFADVDFSTVNTILAKNTIERIKKPNKTEVGNILLAGATGYLGIHILADYLEHDTGIAYCIVRGKDKADSEKRMADLLEFYFGDKYKENDRIKIVCADLQKDKLGLYDEEYADLLGNIDTVINCAASVKHYGSYKYFYEANVETTKLLIEFSKKANAKLIHTSTLSVSGNTFGDDFDGYISKEELHFYESSLYIGQPLDNVYARSKFEAEKAVLDAMAEGLQANIMRMGNLTNRYSDGVFQKNHESNTFLKHMKAILELGCVPDYLLDFLYCEYTPIDEAANAVMTIARNFSKEQTVFHINSIKVVYLDKLIEHFNALGYEMKIVDGKIFSETLRQTAKQAGMEHIFETFINDMDENDKLQYDSNIRIENDFTVQYLKQLGFEWKDIDLEYLRRYVEYFRKIGYLK